MEEIWKNVKDYEGKYQVSNLGNVKSLARNKKMRFENEKHGYLRITLYKDKKKTHFFVHRLVAQAFIPNPENKVQVNHKDGNKKITV